jgi:hypothetical protein
MKEMNKMKEIKERDRTSDNDRKCEIVKMNSSIKKRKKLAVGATNIVRRCAPAMRHGDWKCAEQ